jgi:pimeloyl-ACP methyl ester carboxylesterase
MARVALAVAALAAAVGTATAAAGLSGSPKLRETCLTAKERSAAISFSASDGARLSGVLLGRGPRAVVLSHEFGADLCSWLPYGRTLVGRGYRVLAIDLRGFGSSALPPAGRGATRFDLDVTAAVALVRRRGARRVVLAGGSIGGAATLVAASAVRPDVDGVVSLSAPVNAFGVNALAAVAKLLAPVLLVNGKNDPIVPPDSASRLYRAAASRDKRLVILPSGEHGSKLLSGGEGARARRIVDAFVAVHLAG